MKTITPGQKKQLGRFFADTLEKVPIEQILDDLGIDSLGAQRVIEHGDEFAEVVRRAVIASIKDLSVSDKFKNEEVTSIRKYPSGYKGPRPIQDQIAALAQMLNLDPSQALKYAKNLPQLPQGAEGWFAVPSVVAIAAKHFPEVNDSAQQYCEAIKFLLGKIAASRKFYNYRADEMDPEHLRLHIRTTQALEALADDQPGDILIVAVQLGMRHRGRSVRRAREVFQESEFGMEPVMGAAIALTHPERFQNHEELDIDLAGAEFSPGGDGGFSRSPLLYFRGGRVEFGTFYLDGPDDNFGAGSWFPPQ